MSGDDLAKMARNEIADAEQDLAEAAADLEIARSDATTSERARRARMAINAIANGLRRLARASAFEDAAKGEP